MNISFTGHRPNKLGGYNWNTSKNKTIMKELKHQIIHLINSTDEKQFHFYFGGALGIDQMAFSICYDIKYYELHLNQFKIVLEYAIPFLNQDVKWNINDRNRWRQQMDDSDIVTKVDTLEKYKIKGYKENIYYPAKMQKRNQYMVDNSDIVIAVWDGSKGGTYNCVKYAQKLGKRIIQINPNSIE